MLLTPRPSTRPLSPLTGIFSVSQMFARRCVSRRRLANRKNIMSASSSSSCKPLLLYLRYLPENAAGSSWCQGQRKKKRRSKGWKQAQWWKVICSISGFWKGDVRQCFYECEAERQGKWRLCRRPPERRQEFSILVVKLSLNKMTTMGFGLVHHNHCNTCLFKVTVNFSSIHKSASAKLNSLSVQTQL